MRKLLLDSCLKLRSKLNKMPASCVEDYLEELFKNYYLTDEVCYHIEPYLTEKVVTLAPGLILGEYLEKKFNPELYLSSNNISLNVLADLKYVKKYGFKDKIFNIVNSQIYTPKDVIANIIEANGFNKYEQLIKIINKLALTDGLDILREYQPKEKVNYDKINSLSDTYKNGVDIVKEFLKEKGLLNIKEEIKSDNDEDFAW